MKLNRIIVSLLSVTVMSWAAEDIGNHTYPDGTGITRVLNLKPSQDTESLNWLKQDQSFAIQLSALNPNTLPSKYSNKGNCSPVWDQQSLGSCTGFASKSAAELVTNLITPDKKDDFIASALFQYYNERILEGTTEEDSGASIADAIRALKIYGIAPDADWSYENYQTKFKEEPTKQAYQDAKNHKDLDNIGHAQIPNDPDTIKTAILQNHAVIIGIRVYESFMSRSVATTGFVPVPDITTEKPVGGHALLITGYDNDNKWYEVKNSWGENWGDQGYCYIPYNIIHNSYLTPEIWGIKKMGTTIRAWYNPLRLILG